MNQTAKNILQFLIGFAAILLLGYCGQFLFFAFFVILVAPFVGFTFTDATDFAPIGIILLSFAGLALRHARRPYPDGWVRVARGAAYVLSVLTPLLYLGALYALAWYGTRAIGHFPQPMMDDPKHIAHDDAAYQKMYQVVDYIEAFSGAFILAWTALILHLRHHLTRKDWFFLGGLFLLGWMLFVMEPGRRFEWWLD